MAQAHPDLAAKVTQIDITRYGHAMTIPIPQNLDQIRLQPPSVMRGQLSKKYQSELRQQRILFAHSDWAGYSVFEEAFTLGTLAGSLRQSG